MGIDDLYREVVMDHFRRPRNHGRVDSPNVVVEGVNPLCGDEIVLSLKVDDGVVSEAKFEGHGCSISQASASIMTEIVNGKPIAEVEQIVQRFRAMMLEGETPDMESLGDGVALEGVKQFPVRIKCAVLGWNTLLQGIHEHTQANESTVQAKHSES